MNTAMQLIEEIEAQGCKLETDGERIKLKAPQPLPDELVESLRVKKDDVVVCLTQRWIERHDATKPHLRVIRGSITRPEDFNHLSEDYRETWQAITYGLIVDGGWSREQAEVEAWQLIGGDGGGR